jgi:carboxypeptidase T
MPIMFADFLVNNYSTDDRIKRIVDARDIWIVPLVNPDGHEHSVTVDRLWRKNFPGVAGRDSVDPNRNYDTTTWASPTGAFSDDPTNDSYRGPSGAFAKEVVNMQTLITSKRFKGSLDYHSFGRFVLFPFCGRTGPHPDPNQDTMADHVDHVVDSHGVAYTKLQASHLYRQPPWSRAPDDALVPGGLMDFVVENVPDSIAITVELEPEQSDPRGFVLPPSEIQPTFDRHLGSMLAFLNCVGTLATPATVRAMALAAGTSNNFSVFSSPCFSPFETF